MGFSFQVVRSNLGETRLVQTDSVVAKDGEVVLAVERFGLTANNITYGIAGDMIGYWQFFPAEDAWGQIPVWGIGRVVSSGVADVNEGSRYYGYFPMSSELVVRPKIRANGFADASEHRSALPPVYNQYSLVEPANGFEPGQDNHNIVYRPLFSTGFILDDFLDDNNCFGAEQIVLSSASSKTAFSLASMLSDRDTVRVIGLTSAGNRAFVENMGIYHETVCYDDLSGIDADKKTAFVDMAGNGKVRSALHHHCGDNLVYSGGVGITHWDSFGSNSEESLPGATPQMFFAPDQMKKRNDDWGPAEYQRRVDKAWGRFVSRVDDWVTLEEHGAEELEAVYRQVLGGASPDRAIVVAL